MIRARLVLVAVAAVAALVAPTAYATESGDAIACVPRVLVLSAMPLELDPLLRDPSFTLAETVTAEKHTLYVGTLGGKDVILAMTGIGMVNASQTSAAAYALPNACITGTIFSGVAGSRQNIGDVTVPKRWTLDSGEHWLSVEGTALYQAASTLAAGSYALSQVTPVGDAACACPGVADPGTPIAMPDPLKLVVGGDGTTSDMFSGRAIPCLPGGGDVAGCAPCALDTTTDDVAAFGDKTPALLDQEFVQGFFQPPAATTDAYDAQDMETASAAAAAATAGVPFLGVRAVSDGQNDPLHLPGFPAQFFVYRRLAANNAAAVTVAVLRALQPPA